MNWEISILKNLAPNLVAWSWQGRSLASLPHAKGEQWVLASYINICLVEKARRVKVTEIEEPGCQGDE